MAVSYLSKITTPAGTTYHLKDAIGRNYIDAILPKAFGTAYATNTAYSAGNYIYSITESGSDGTVALTVYRVTENITAGQNTSLSAIASKITSITVPSELDRLQNAIDSINNFTYIVSKTASDTPLGVDNYYTGSKVTGTLAASATTMYQIYLVKLQSTLQSDDVNAEYVTVLDGTTYSWEKIGTTAAEFDYDTTDVIASVTVDTTNDSVLGAGTGFTNSTSAVTFTGDASDEVLGSDTTFTATGTNVSLATGTITNSDIFNSGDGNEVRETTYSVSNETLSIGYSTTAKIGTAKTLNKTFATGTVSSVTQPTITVGSNDLVEAVTDIGTGTAAAQTITVDTADRVDALISASASTTTATVLTEPSA